MRGVSSGETVCGHGMPCSYVRSADVTGNGDWQPVSPVRVLPVDFTVDIAQMFAYLYPGEQESSRSIRSVCDQETRRMMLNKMTATVLFVQDLEKCMKFYEDIFDLEALFTDADSAAYQMEDHDWHCQVIVLEG